MLIAYTVLLTAGVLMLDLWPQVRSGRKKGMWLYLAFSGAALVLMILFARNPGLTIAGLYFTS